MCGLFSRRQLGRCFGALGLGLSTLMATAGDTLFPDVLAVKVRAASANVYDFDVTVSSPYDRPTRYADGFRVLSPQGLMLGERKLWHDHQGEQPFTRDLYGVRVPGDVRTVLVQARDQINGYGGKTVTVALPGR